MATGASVQIVHRSFEVVEVVEVVEGDPGDLTRYGPRHGAVT
jgi:hypothetical protein